MPHQKTSWLTTLCNMLNLPFGIATGLAWIITGFLYCITIIGIPLGLQQFKLALLPFGATVAKPTLLTTCSLLHLG